MILFKSCPRCLGDKVLERDEYGWYITCIACGHVSYPVNKRRTPVQMRDFGREGYASRSSKEANSDVSSIETPGREEAL